MAKTFLYLLICAVLLNFAIKAACYATYSKAQGKVADLISVSSVSHGNGEIFLEDAVAPTISYTINGTEYRISKGEWGFWTSYTIGDNVTVLYADDPENPQINRFFPYWLRLMDMCLIFGFAALGTIVYETIRFYATNVKDNTKP